MLLAVMARRPNDDVDYARLRIPAGTPPNTHSERRRSRRSG
jgi:hypothetical protein